MNLQESGEMYLETILVLHQRNGNVRSIDIANEMNFSKPSVSRAMSKLREGGFVNMDNDGMITLTPSGREIAEKIFERHNVLSKLLIQLGVDKETATEDACRIEHVISDKSFAAVKDHVKWLPED